MQLWRAGGSSHILISASSSFLVAILIVLSVCSPLCLGNAGTTPSTDVSLGLSWSERNQLVEFHSSIRARVQPTAANMAMLNYSMEHEEKATTWLEACRFIDPEDEKAAGFETTNQNLAMTTTLNTTVLQLAGAWAHEETHFRWEEAGSGSSCLHCGFYAKMIWATSRQLGCARKTCGDALYLMCVYSPGGSWRQDRPYQGGKSCSGCGGGEVCRRRQCQRRPDSRSALEPYFCGLMAALVFTALD